jgi:hypothetical protein
MNDQKLIACHECDRLFEKPAGVRGRVACRSRRGAHLKGIHGVGLPLDRISPDPDRQRTAHDKESDVLVPSLAGGSDAGMSAPVHGAAR